MFSDESRNKKNEKKQEKRKHNPLKTLNILIHIHGREVCFHSFSHVFPHTYMYIRIYTFKVKHVSKLI